MITISRKHLPCGALRRESFCIWPGEDPWLNGEIGKIDWAKCLGTLKATTHKAAMKQAQEKYPGRQVWVSMGVAAGSDLIVPNEGAIC